MFFIFQEKTKVRAIDEEKYPQTQRKIRNGSENKETKGRIRVNYIQITKKQEMKQKLNETTRKISCMKYDEVIQKTKIITGGKQNKKEDEKRNKLRK